MHVPSKIASSKIALAVFVKTPGLSPIKTRLAATLGSSRALKFYEDCLRLTDELLQDLRREFPDVQPYWAVAETDGMQDRRWQSQPRIHQGAGTLGERLSRVHDELLARHGAVAFMGADCPVLHTEVLRPGIEMLRQGQDVIGPTEDGGYYFFATQRGVPRPVWLEVPYSSTDTAAVFLRLLEATRPVIRLQTLFDVDTEDDLRKLSEIEPATPTIALMKQLWACDRHQP